MLGVMLNWIRWWGSDAGALESLEYVFVAITSRSTGLLGFHLMTMDQLHKKKKKKTNQKIYKSFLYSLFEFILMGCGVCDTSFYILNELTLT